MNLPYRYLTAAAPLPVGALIHFSLKRKAASGSLQDTFDTETLHWLADSWLAVSSGLSILILVTLLVYDISEWISHRREKERIRRILAESDD